MLKRLRVRSVDAILSIFHMLVKELEEVEQYALDKANRLRAELNFHQSEVDKARTAINQVQLFLGKKGE